MVKRNLEFGYKGVMSQIFIPIILFITIINFFYNMHNEFVFITEIICLSLAILLFTISIIKIKNKELGNLKLIGRGYFFICIISFVFLQKSQWIIEINIELMLLQILIFLGFINIIISTIIYSKNYSEKSHWVFFLVILQLILLITKNQKNIYYFISSKLGAVIMLMIGTIMFLSILKLYRIFNLEITKKLILQINYLLLASNIFVFLNILTNKDFSYFIWISILTSCYLLYNDVERTLLYNIYLKKYENLNKVKEVKKNLNKNLKNREKELKELNLLLEKSEKNYDDVLKVFSKGLLLFENDILISSNYLDIENCNNKLRLNKRKVKLNELLSKITGEVYNNKEIRDFSTEVKIEDKFGRLRDYEIYLININGNRKLLVFYDVTEIIKQREEIVKLDKKLKEKNANDEFYSNISHELRTPINVIYSALQLNDMYLKNNKMDNINKNNNIIKQNCLRLIRTINNFIDSNKLSEGFLESHFDIYNIVDIIENIILSCDSYMKYKKNNLVYDPEFEEIYFNCDKDYIERIMLNILSNSLKHGKDNGNIYVTTRIENNKIIIEVINDAETIPEDKRNVIFEKFTKVNSSFNRSSEGTGLGLYLTKGLVELHGGEISIAPGVLNGNIYKIILPFDKNIQIKENRLNKIEINEIQQKIDIEFSDIYF